MPRIRTTPATSALAATTAAALCLAAAGSPAHADSVVTAPLSVQGIITNFGQNNANYNAAPGNILVGQYPNGTVAFHDYFVFDLSSLPANSATVTSATLTLTTPFHSYISPSASETWALYDVNDSSLPTLHDQNAWLQYAVYDDLAAGQTYGSHTFTVAEDQTTVSVTLDAAALHDIQSRLGSEFAIGGALTTLADAPSSTQQIFAFSGYDTHTTLSLTLGPATPAAAPLPSAATAGLALLLPLYLKRRRPTLV